MNLSLSNFKSKTLHTMRYWPRMRIICYLSSVKYFVMTYQSSGVQMMLSYPVNRRGTNGWVRITEWLRLGGPLEVSLRQGYLEPVAQDYTQMASECLQRWRVRNLPGKSMPVLAHHHSKSSWCSEENCCVSGCAHCLWSCYWVPLRRSWWRLLHTIPLGTYKHQWVCPWVFSWKEAWTVPTLSSFPPPVLQSLNHLCGPWLDSLQCFRVFSVLGSPELAPVLQVCPHQCWVWRKDHLLRPAGNTFPNAG